jgi:hypothetical protein
MKTKRNKIDRMIIKLPWTSGDGLRAERIETGEEGLSSPQVGVS